MGPFQGDGPPFGGFSESDLEKLFGPGQKKEEKGVPWEAKLIDGVYYIPLAQVADLLEVNDILPKVKRGIQARVEMQALRKEQGL